ncbi:winged helix-turn-helix domain-containing protein [Rhodococcus sp. Z13]|uniref:Winged helix-turn-helix domain-containing protein n=1 Tax=Rhodococcus sacchari TaxID=2962047 RepID=A0ACD4DH33_9NOCA|nr:winged helix-turn-helix domain-containing protein [Rhodococcus sp. Z13]UYP19359.1 winged helix-turn-helix domain-containing protein [Rhodococcus sp. Z13]
MTISPVAPPVTGGSTDSPELVLIVHVSDTDAGSAGDLAALADALRETALDMLPGARTRTLLSAGPASLVIDLPARGLVLDGTRVELSHTEFEILSYLVRQPRVVVTRASLRPLGTGYSGNDPLDADRGNRSVDVHVSRIRSKLGRFGNIITTVRGSGYRYDPDPRVFVVEALDRRTA